MRSGFSNDDVELAATPSERMSSSELAAEWIKTQNRILAFICSLVNDFNEAEDLLQETAAKVFASVDRYDRSRLFLPWAIGIARHVVLDHRRRSSHDVHIFDHEIIDGLAEVFENVSDRSEFARQSLSKCLERVSPSVREVLRLRYEKNLTPTAIASQFGKPPGMVRMLLHRVRAQLRECIEQRFRAEGLQT